VFQFGNEGKVVLTYCWEDVKPDFNIRATLQHMLLAAKLILNKNTVSFLLDLTPIFMNKMLALKFVLSIVSRHLIGQF
jgi:hypothetical protein